MKEPHQRATKVQSTGTTAEPAPRNPAANAYVRKSNAIKLVAMDLLSHMEKTLQQNPAAIVGKQTNMLPRERQDKQAYFLEKITHARKTLNELMDLLPAKTEDPAIHEQISAELMVFFALIESFRPQRMLESGWNPGEVAQAAIREKVESLVLDVVNMRERLK